jgi:hypothetical protein
MGKKRSAILVADSLARPRGSYEFGIRPMYRARIAAVLGDRDDAVARIREAFADGAAHNLVLHRDTDFERLRSYQAFVELLRGQD